MLTTLALSPQVTSGDFAGLHQTLSRAVPLPGAWFVLSERSGREVINTRVPFGDTLPGRTEPETVDRVFVTEKPVVSNVFRARLTGQPVVSLDVPVVRDGAVAYTLALVLPPESFTQIMHDQHMPPSWIGAVAQREGDERLRAEPAPAPGLRRDFSPLTGGTSICRRRRRCGRFRNRRWGGFRRDNRLSRISFGIGQGSIL